MWGIELFNGEFGEWISNFVAHVIMDVIIYTGIKVQLL